MARHAIEPKQFEDLKKVPEPGADVSGMPGDLNQPWLILRYCLIFMFIPKFMCWRLRQQTQPYREVEADGRCWAHEATVLMNRRIQSLGLQMCSLFLLSATQRSNKRPSTDTRSLCLYLRFASFHDWRDYMSILYKWFSLGKSVIAAQKGLTRVSSAVRNEAGSWQEQMHSRFRVRILPYQIRNAVKAREAGFWWIHWETGQRSSDWATVSTSFCFQGRKSKCMWWLGRMAQDIQDG